MVYLGIDPGVGGGIAILNADGSVVRVVKMPKDATGVLAALTTDIGLAVAVLEHVWSMPGQGHGGAFTFGRGFGRLEMALTAAAIPFTLVVPRKWQPAMGVYYPKGRDKNIAKARAHKLFPKTVTTHATADALLIAAYCRWLHTGSLDTNPRRRKKRR